MSPGAPEAGSASEGRRTDARLVRRPAAPPPHREPPDVPPPAPASAETPSFETPVRRPAARGRAAAGFSLIEIAIVLVVIGLLLGAVMKGQELIGSARVRNMADSAAGIQSAYFGFVDRYRRVPGDWNAAEAGDAIGLTVTGGGNDNGRIDNEPGSEWTEPNALWEQLATAGFMKGEFEGDTAAPTAGNRRAPLNPFNRVMVLGRTDDYLDAGGASPVRLNLVLGRGIPVDLARELDVKIDDGAPDTGALRLTVSTGATFGDAAEGAAQCVRTGRGGARLYDVAADSQDCNVAYLF